MSKTDANIFHVLYADDNPGDIELASEALTQAVPHCKFTSVKNGEEALNFLYRRGQFSKTTPRPDLILLDWNMPKINGLEILKTIKSDKHLFAIPTIIFTSSSREEDISAAYGAGANCYVIKPAHLDLFLETFKSIIRHWNNVAG
jgi:chemotaxis family two-component system response regulator Rcp1